MTIAFNPDRFWDSLDQMARIGATPDGGVKRLALSPEDDHARKLLRDWAIAAGCIVTVDRLGSMYCTYPGADPDAAPVAVGSHLDSVPTGGKYDGPYGVLLGLEIVRALREAGRRTKAPIVVVNWTNEEGSRFSPAMSASGGAMGVIEEAKVLAAPDNFDHSFTYADALQATGWAGTIDPAKARDFAAYYEAHIEQGPILERDGIPIGVVTHCIGVEQWDVTVSGTDGHVGYPMAGRQDALAAASELILALERTAIETGGMGTATRITLQPDARGNIPSMVRFAANIRHPDADGNARMEAAFRQAAAGLSARRGVRVHIDRVGGYPRVPFAPPLLDTLRWPLEKIWWGYILDTEIPCQYCVRYSGDDYCPVCYGGGVIYPRVEVPSGKWYQLWEDTTEGSPMTPPFETIEELARYCADPKNDVTTFGSDTQDYETWLEFFGSGQDAFSLAIVDGEVISGVEAIAKNKGKPVGDNFDNLTETEYAELNNFFASEFLGDQNAG